MDFELRECRACNGVPGKWNPACGGCGQWILVGQLDGIRYGGPYDDVRRAVVPWVGMPTEAQVEAVKQRMMAPFAIVESIVDAIGALTS
jgi:hypothetical protein